MHIYLLSGNLQEISEDAYRLRLKSAAEAAKQSNGAEREQGIGENPSDQEELYADGDGPVQPEEAEYSGEEMEVCDEADHADTDMSDSEDVNYSDADMSDSEETDHSDGYTADSESMENSDWNPAGAEETAAETSVKDKKNIQKNTSGKQAARQPKQKKTTAVFVTSSRGIARALQLADITVDMEKDQNGIDFCKVETQQDCLVGALKIPKLSDVRGSAFRIRFFVNRKHIVIVDDSDMSLKIIQRICRLRTKPGSSRERFLYSYLAQFITRDSEYLGGYERRIAALDDRITDGNIEDLQDDMQIVRRELLTLRSYYMELRDVGKQLEENENNVFSKKNLSYFGVLTDRAERLLGKTIYLLDYVGQVRDSYQIEVAEQQNKNMEFLTMVSTIFYPLTLITGWYGMNFQNMPELAHGYPFIILLSILVIIIVILIFKKRKIL